MATRQEQFVIDDKGKKTGVIVPVKQYQKYRYSSKTGRRYGQCQYCTNPGGN